MVLGNFFIAEGKNPKRLEWKWKNLIKKFRMEIKLSEQRGFGTASWWAWRLPQDDLWQQWLDLLILEVVSCLPLLSTGELQVQHTCSHSKNVGIILPNNHCVVAHYLILIFLFNSVPFEFFYFFFFILQFSLIEYLWLCSQELNFVYNFQISLYSMETLFLSK